MLQLYDTFSFVRFVQISVWPLAMNLNQFDKTEEMYITAELTSQNFPESFTVGDGAEYGGYRNKPLKNGVYTFKVGFRPLIQSQVMTWYTVPKAERITSETFCHSVSGTVHGFILK